MFLPEHICFFVTVIFIYGLLFGSFFNVLIYRLPNGQSIVFPASHCPECNHTLAWFENIPLLSFFILKGMCKGCKTKISIQYPLIEFITGIYSVCLFFILLPQIKLAMSGNWWNWIEIFLQYFTLLLFIPLAIIDIRHYIIPDEITITGIVLSLAVSFLPNGITPFQSFIGALSGSGFLFLVGVIGKKVMKRDAMGGGDIKFLIWIGALFGFQIALSAIFIGSFLGIIFSKVKNDNDGEVPFCPYLCFGVLVFVVFGEDIANLIF